MLSYNIEGKIEVANTAALKLLNVYRLNHINDIKLHNEGVYNCIVNLTKGTPVLQKIDNQELSFAVVEVSIRGRKIRLVSIHDIKTQLEHRESEAWQNLTKVLRHEIMNSVTPIVSMVETMQEIVDKDLKPSNPEEIEAIQDLQYALNTVQKRGLGIMKFVEAYREFTSIPKPQVQLIDVSELISNINQIHFSQLKSKDIVLNIHIEQDFQLLIDIDLIEQVLINIIKNATESGREGVQLCIDITTKLNQKDKLIEIKDNGIGIEPDNQTKIFIPFFTSKATGSGIGLSLSRQIMQLHGGNITFTPNEKYGSVFGLSFVG
jgi:signal transduction histidine kinase